MSVPYGYPPDAQRYGQPPYVHQPQPFTPPSGGQIVPGSITYTTSTGADGRIMYHPFKAVPASYQTSSGVVTGIQWVPAEATQILPVGAQPATADFAASWHRSNSKDQKALKEWQKEEDKRRKKEEKHAAKRLREREREESELRKARDREIGHGHGGYGTNPYGGDLDRRFGEMGLRDEDKQRGLGRPRKYSVNESDPAAGGTYPVYSSPYTSASRANTYPPVGGGYGPASRGASPNVRPVDIPRSTTPVPGAAAGTGVTGFPQATIPGGSPYTAPSGFPPEQQQLPAPEAFNRPVNAAHPYTPFDTMKIQDMDDFIDNLPKLPLVLQPHDVYHDDWIRFMQDVARAWTGTLPVPDLHGRTPKRATLTADLVDTWNKSFFIARGVEVALYKGHEKRSGPDAGTVDPRLPSFDPDSLSSSSSSTSSDSSELSGDERYGQGGYGMYGRQVPGQPGSRRQDKKAEKKRRAKEKKQRKKAKEREKRYALYIICVPQGGVYNPGYPPMGGRSSPMPGGHGIGGRASPIPGSIGGRSSPLPGSYGNMGGRTSPMPGGYNTMGGRTSPMPGGYNAMGGRTSPMPGGYGAGGRTSPMPGGGPNPMGGRSSPMPAPYAPLGGRSSPMPAPYAPLGGRSSPMPGGKGY